MRPFVVGTAGHVDHGKSALVRALTGTDPDRLPEEKRRGITIELGFAHAPVAPGVEAAFVDVPGHERFVREMIAGAHGMDVVLLVVALEEGVMPQTREHAQIARLLAVPRAVVALAKDDLASALDPEWQQLVLDDIRSLGGLFASAPVVRVSARTGTGLAQLKAALARAAADLPARATDAPALLPIDRAFTLRGQGTVVAGTLVAGALSVDDAVELALPAPRAIRVREGLRARSLQTHGRPVVHALAGQRVAVNLPGVEVQEVAGGSVLCAADTAHERSGTRFDVELELAGGAALPNRSQVSLHLGTARALASVDLLGRERLEGNERMVAHLSLDRALVGVREQRFVLRGYRALPHGGRTLAGGRILYAPRQRRRVADRATVEALAQELPIAARAVVVGSRLEGVDARSLALNLGAPVDCVPGAVRAGGRWFDSAALEALESRIRTQLRARPGLPREELRQSLGSRVFPAAFAHALEVLGPQIAGSDTMELAGRPKSALEETIARAITESGLEPPTVCELSRSLGIGAPAIENALRALARRGEVVRLTAELFTSSAAAQGFRSRVVEALTDRGELSTPELKEIAGTSRKFLIPLCEWLDREHVTLRVGDKRTARRST